MLSESTCVADRPDVILFLDIDGVVYRKSDPQMVFKKVKELFPTVETFDNKVCSIAAAHFFSKIALENLDAIIAGIEKTRKVSIVITSSWREGRSAEELRTTFFGIHDFSKYIVDTTPVRTRRAKIEGSCVVNPEGCDCRAEEIQAWLTNNPHIREYIVLDDYNSHLRENFKERFFEINFLDLLTREIADEILRKWML